MADRHFDLTDKVVIVTGAGQGIGRQYAHAFAEAGAKTVVAELNGQNAQKVAREIDEAGGTAIATQTDVGDRESADAMVAETLDAYGRIDVLVNNAALFSTLERRKFEDIPLDEWNNVLHVNITGSYLCACAVLPAMRRAGGGRIINISSGTVPQGKTGIMHYTTSKAAVVGMTRVMARELGDDNINVNAVMPGYIETEIDHASMNDEGRQAVQNSRIFKRPETPDELVGTLLFLASPAAAFITGQTIAVCGGEVML